jgi:hypothetical protein
LHGGNLAAVDAAGIIAQLAVLDDAEIIGTDKSSAAVLGPTSRDLARLLTSHLLARTRPLL